MFHYPYSVKQGENLTTIGAKFGYKNPGPIYFYPPNNGFFTGRKQFGNLVFPNDEVFIPWNFNELEKVISTSKYLIVEIQKSKRRFLRQEIKSVKELNNYLKKVDTINFLASIGVNITSLSIKSIKGATMTTKEALIWLLNDRVKLSTDILSTFIVDSPRKPKNNFRFYIRHGLGPWNPSYWASVYAALRTRDLDAYLYGTNVLHQKNIDLIVKQSQKDIYRLQSKIAELEKQKSMPFYNKVL